MGKNELTAIVVDKNHYRCGEQIFLQDGKLSWADGTEIPWNEYEIMLDLKQVDTLASIISREPENYPRPVKVIERPNQQNQMFSIFLALAVILFGMLVFWQLFIGVPLQKVFGN